MTTPKPSAPREFDEEAFAAVYQPELKHDKIHEALEEGARWQFEQDRAAYEALEKKFREVFGPGGTKAVHKLIDEREALEKELKDLREFKKQWNEKDGNSPGYNCEKAKNYGNQAFHERCRSTRLIESLRQIKERCSNVFARRIAREAIRTYESEGE